MDSGYFMYNLYDIAAVKRILSRHGFTFSKALGQNFIVDASICPAMAEQAGIDRDTLVLEIGPGIGVLTRELCLRAGKVVAVELDKRLMPVLDETLGDFDNLTVVNADVMKLDLHKLIEEHKNGCSTVRVCANLPYYITSPVIMMLLEERLDVASVTVMVQKEAADRLCAAVGTRDSSAVTVAVNYYAEAEALFDVGRDCFLPVPKVDSAVIHLTVRDTPAVSVADETKFFRLVRAAFSQRRKTAVNSVSALTGVSKEQVAGAFARCGIDLSVRAEKMTMDELARLGNELDALI